MDGDDDVAIAVARASAIASVVAVSALSSFLRLMRSMTSSKMKSCCCCWQVDVVFNESVLAGIRMIGKKVQAGSVRR